VRLSELLSLCRRGTTPGEAEIIASAASGIPRGRLFLSMDEETGDADRRALAMIARRTAGEPLQYVLGAWDFHGREFRLSPDTLIPRRRDRANPPRATASRPGSRSSGATCFPP
jgi:release factor glutamine methyltransferase